MTEQEEKTHSANLVFIIKGHLNEENYSDLQKLLLIYLTLSSFVNKLHYEKYIQFSKTDQTEEK